MKIKNPPKTRDEWIDYGRQLSLNPYSVPRQKGKWVKDNGLDYVKDKVERSNAINLYKQVKEGVDLSKCPLTRPSDTLHWLREMSSGVMDGASNLYFFLRPINELHQIKVEHQ